MKMHTPIEPVAATVTSVSATLAVILAGLNISAAGAIVSAAVALAGLLLNIWATKASQRRQQEQHELMMENLRGSRTNTESQGRARNNCDSEETRG